MSTTDESLHVRRRSTSHHSSSQHHDSPHHATNSATTPTLGVANQVAVLTAMLNEKDTALEAANNRSNALMSELAASRSETTICRQKAEELATALSVSCERTHSVMRLVESNNHSHAIEMKKLKAALSLQQERFDVAMEVDRGVASLYLSLKAHAAHIKARGLGGTATMSVPGSSSSSFGLESEDITSASAMHPLALLQASSNILQDVSHNVVSTAEVTEFLKAVISVRSAILAKKESSSNSLQAVVATIRATGTMPRGVVDYLMASGLVGGSNSSSNNTTQPTATVIDPKAASSPKRITPSQGGGGGSGGGELTGEMHFLLHSKLSKTDVPALHDLIDGLRAALEAQMERTKESLRRHLQEVSLLMEHHEGASSKGVQSELAALRVQLRELETSSKASTKELHTLRDSKNICRRLEKERDAAIMEAEKHSGRVNTKDRLLKETQETLAVRLKEHAHQMATLSVRASEAAKLSSQNIALTAEVETLRGQLLRLDVRGLKGARDRAEEISLRKEAALADATKLNLEHERRLSSLKEANERMALEYTAIFKAHVAATQKQDKRRVAEDMAEASQYIVGSQSPLAAEHYLRKYQDAMSELHAAQRKLRHLLILSHHDQSSSATRITHLESELEETKRRKGAGWDGSDAHLDGSNLVGEEGDGDDRSMTLDDISLVGTSSSPVPEEGRRSMNSAATSQHRLRRAGSALQQRRSLYNNPKAASVNPALLADIVDNVTISPLARTVSLATSKERRTSVVVGSVGSRRSSSPSGTMSPPGAPLADIEPDSSSLSNNRQFSASDLPNYNTRQDLHSLHQRLTKEKVSRGTARLNVGGEHQHASPTNPSHSHLSSKARRLVSKGLESKTVRQLDNVVLGAMLEKGSDCGSGSHSDGHPDDDHEEVVPPPHEVSYRSVPSRATQRTFDLISSPMGRRPASSGSRGGSSQSPTPDAINSKPPSAGVITGRTPVRLGLAPSRRSDRTKK